MRLEYFQKIITNLDEIYSKKASDEEIECTINVNGSIYRGIYEPNCFDNESIIVLNKGYIMPYKMHMLNHDNFKAYININKIDAFTYLIKTKINH